MIRSRYPWKQSFLRDPDCFLLLANNVYVTKLAQAAMKLAPKKISLHESVKKRRKNDSIWLQTCPTNFPFSSRFSRSALLGRLYMHEARQGQARTSVWLASLRSSILQIEFRQQQHEDAKLKAHTSSKDPVRRKQQFLRKGTIHNIFCSSIVSSSRRFIESDQAHWWR